MKTITPMTDPAPDHAVQLQLQEYAAMPAPIAAAGPPGTCVELDRYDIAVVLQTIYEWGGYRYTNASDAIAAAKRVAK